MKVEFNLPQKYETGDFHEFCYIEEHLKTIVDTNIKVQDMGWNGKKYVGIIYVGKVNDSNNVKLYRSIKKEIVEG